jgi:DMSO/TMAO reductase YedYZ molybdopterin-dependent catalytic subunit
MPFFFTAAHHWMGWVVIGGLLAHIGVKLPVIRDAFRRPAGDGPVLTRRGLLGAVAAAAGVITVGTIGQTVAPLARISLLAPRRPTTGPQRVPVNKTAAAAGVRNAALDPAYRLRIAGPGRQVELSMAELAALPQHTVVLPIACVEGWSSTGTWSGVRLRDLAALAGVDPDRAEAEVESLEAGGRYRTSTVAPPHLRDSRTLIALKLGGAALAMDHGFPARLIAPNRPGVMQTKWVATITVRSAS